MSEPLITLSEVDTWFSNSKTILGKTTSWVKAVNKVNLTIHQGECLGLVGESGCGKSTLGRTILRLTPLHSGTITFAGEELSGLDDRRLRTFRPRMQMVFQDPKASLNPKMTVFQILAEALKLNNTITRAEFLEKAVELLDVVDLRPEHLYRYPHEFSGGQQQRISIARALATNPEFIVFDEATSALDVSVQAQILNLMGELQQKYGLTYLFISHDLSIMEQACERVAVMYSGEIVEIQQADRLFSAPRHPYTKALLRAVPIADPQAKGELGILAGEVPKLSAPPPGCKFHPRCQFADEVCRIRVPEVDETGGKSWVRCHHHTSLVLASEKRKGEQDE